MRSLIPYLRSANIFVGASFINELDEYMGHAYLGGKVKVSDWALITGAYGIGVGNEKDHYKGGLKVRCRRIH